jgi:hypothetical protein
VTSVPDTSSTAPGSTVTTTSAPLITTSTTVPDPCAHVARGATFDSLECRLGDVDEALQAASTTAPRAGAIRQRLAQVTGQEAQARARCAGGDSKSAKKELKRAFKKASRVRALLAAKSSKAIPGRDGLKADIDGIRVDLKSLKSAVVCPGDAVAGR